ncbi:phage tail tape measure protein [Pseudomonas koreensis]|uniref:phage tail tape measure protein n=1 Tax=Pseudomonas koreensis TaxID=198620 RepID=UPI001B33B18C|nr:phage tail tape measure protein [Pseudomonas koreensis]MBP4002070.1 phage tail tape measure protein [Pseudomonas koreensis]
MADTRYAPMLASETKSMAFGNARLAGGSIAPDSLGTPLVDLSLALAMASADIRLLTQEQVKLREVLAAQQSLFKAGTAAPATSEPKSKLKAEVEQRSPLKFMQASIANQMALLELNQIVKLDKDQLRALSQDTQKMTSDKQVAPSGATAVDLLKVQLAAARSGVGEGLEGKAKADALTGFARDAAINASAFGVDVKTASEMMLAWQSAMKLDRTQSQRLADATNFLGHSGLDAKAADIGSVVQSSGEKAMATGLKPEQIAALAAAFLNSGADKASAGAGLNAFTAVLAKGEAATQEQRAAWAQLGIEGLTPETVASGMRTDAPATINQLLEALKGKSDEKERASLTKALFGNDDAIVKLLNKPEDVQKAFSLVPGQDPKSESKPGYVGSVAKTATELGETSQGRWNALDGTVTRLTTALGGSLTNLFDGVVVGLDVVAGGISSFAEEQPKATAALLALAGVIAVSRGAQIKVAMASAMRNAATKLLVTAGAGPIIDVVDRAAGVGPDGKPVAAGSTDNASANSPEQKTKKQKKGGKAKSGAKADVKLAATVEASPQTWGSRFKDANSAAKGFTKSNALLTLVTAVPDVIKGVEDGDNKAVGGAIGSAGGSLAGGYAGAVAGAMIGSFVPIIGTAIGGLVGGIIGSTAGSMGGSWLGEKLAPESDKDKLSPPAEVAKSLSSAQTQNQSVSFSPLIQVTCPAPDTAQQIHSIIEQQISGQFHGQFMPLLMGGNPLGTRRDAALTDGAGT